MRRRRIRILAFSVALAAVFVFPAVAFACPDCPTARVVQASVFNGRFVPQIVMLLIPVFALGVIAAFLHRIGIGGRPELGGDIDR
jgi:hypothetical protein